jgi:hypothetical protein
MKSRLSAARDTLRLDVTFVALVELLPLAEMFPLACNPAIAGAVAIAHEEECVVMADDVSSR